MLAALVLASSPAHAEEALTLTRVLELAVEANPALVRARLDQDASQASVVSSRGIFDPSLSVDGSWRTSQSKGFFQGFPFTSSSRSWRLASDVSHTLGTGTTYALNASMDRNYSSFVTNLGVGDTERIQDAFTSNLSVSVTQQLLEGMRLAYNMRNVTRALQDVDRKDLAAEKAVQDALSQATSAFWTWTYQVSLHAIAEQSESVAAEALRVGQAQLQTGRIAPVEATRLEAALVQAQKNTLDAEIAARRAGDDLALLVGLQPGVDRVPSSGDAVANVAVPSVDEAIEVALAQNLDLALARAEVDFAEVDVENARHARLPSLSATASAGVGAQQDSVGAAIEGLTQPDAFPFFAVSGRLDVPLGNRAARGEAERAAVTRSQRQAGVVELERSVSAQVAQQVRQLQASAKRIELAEANARLAEQTLSAEEALADAGRSIQKTVLEARAEVARTAAEVEKARTDHLLARTELLRLQGLLGR
ncbi:MAG: TolC family protein [Myxococcales bacterium]|nr:TolC family protein [Myxococcales bacterium]